MWYLKTICILCTACILSGCNYLIDKEGLSPNISKLELKKLTRPIYQEEQNIIKAPPIMKQPEIIIPNKFKQKVSLTLNESLSIKSVLYEIANKLNINIQIDTNINSKIIFRASNKPFIEVLDAICNLADLRYTIHRDFLKIENDTPYTRTYNAQFLNFLKDSENKISIATEVNGEKINNQNQSQSSTLTIKAKSDFWSELNEGIGIILGQNTSNRYAINKQSGIITVYANSKAQNDVYTYLNKIKEVNTSQVLIEAKIIEVILNNQYQKGIDWNILFDNAYLSTNISDNINPIPTFTYKVSNLDNIIKALEEFGAVRTVSNPRITAMNNQAAVLKIASNQVYFKLNYDKIYTSRDSTKEDINVSSDIKTVPIGLVMFVQPSIDLNSRVVSLFLRPTITKLQGNVADPAVDIICNTINQMGNTKQYPKSEIPITEIREIASVLKLNDGEVAVLGGFMEVISSKDKSGLPIIKDIPIIDEISSKYKTKDKLVELVILVKVKIIDHPTCQKAADIRLQRFVPDPRPF